LADEDRDPRWHWIRPYLLPVLGAVGAMVLAVWLLDLMPPDRVSFAAGRPGTAYHALAEQYRDILARDGIEATIEETPGSVANVAALTRTDAPADVAFVQGGVPVPPEAPLSALGTMFLEPLWIFGRGPVPDPADPSRWQGFTIAAGDPGSGTRFVVEAALATLGIDASTLDLQAMNSTDSAAALEAGTIDIGVFVGPVTAPYLQQLFADPAVQALSIRDPEALVRRLPFVELTDIPAASFDYTRRRPDERVDLVAMVARLVGREDLHPALVDRLVEAARTVHSGRDLITREGQFPSTIGADMVLNPQAASLIEKGPNPFNRFLPYWIGAQISKFALLLVPLLVIFIPVFRIAPSLYQWRMRGKIWRHYPELRAVEREALVAGDTAALDRLAGRLDAIEAQVTGTRLPPSYREYAYAMRVHLDLVRRRIAERRAGLGRASA
jgi:TRAP-type uncharacterized transport system substrate-binding protein